MSWKKVEENIEKGPVSTAKVLFFGVLLLVAIGVGVNFILKPVQVVEKVLNPDSVVYNYEWFKQQAADIRTIKQKIVVARRSVDVFKQEAGPRSTWTFEDKTEYSRLVTIVDGLVYQANDMIAKYNARSKMVSRSIFKTNDVPTSFPLVD